MDGADEVGLLPQTLTEAFAQKAALSAASTNELGGAKKISWLRNKALWLSVFSIRIGLPISVDE
jgi:hypothetical protein